MSANNLHQQKLKELHSIFPDYELAVLQSFLQAKSMLQLFTRLDFNLDQTIDYILCQPPVEPLEQSNSPQIANKVHQDNQVINSPEVFTDQLEQNEGEESEEERKSAEKHRRKAKEQTPTSIGGGGDLSKPEPMLSQEEQDKRSRELIDQLLALEMQAEIEQEEARLRKHEMIVAENRAIEQDIKNNAHLKKPNAASTSSNQARANQQANIQQQKKPLQDQNPFKQQQQVQQKKSDKKPNEPQKEESLSDQAEKTMNKIGGFFKNAFQKIEDSIAGSPPPIKNSNNNPYARQEESKIKNNRQNKEVQSQVQQPIKKQPEQFVYAHPSPVKRQKPDRVYDKEIIEEIIFHHPPYMVSSPQKLFKTEAKQELMDSDDEDEQDISLHPESKKVLKNTNVNLNKNKDGSDLNTPNSIFGVNDQGEEIIGFNLPPQLQNQNGLRKRRG